MSKTKTARIAELNDLLRTTLSGGQVMLTDGITDLEVIDQAVVLEKVMNFDSFTPDNDPHEERDFGAFEQDGRKVFWKIDYYNRAMDGGSEDPSDASQTARVLTIMLASEY